MCEHGIWCISIGLKIDTFQSLFFIYLGVKIYMPPFVGMNENEKTSN